jgi:hypothetical protein
MTNKTRLESDVESGPSVAIFRDLGYLRDLSDMGECIFFDEDYCMPTTYATAAAQAGVLTYQDTNVTISGKAINDTDVELGVLNIDVLDTDNDEGSVQYGIGNQWRIDTTAGNASAVGYEVRLRVDELAANETGIMVGFLEGPLATQVSVDDNGTIKASISFIGFLGLATDPSNIDIVYQNTATAGGTTLLANAAALTENEYIKLGMKFDPDAQDPDKKMAFYVDGVVVAYANAAQVAGANFPLGEGMVPFVLGKTFGSGTSGTVSIDRSTGFMKRNAFQG